MFDIKKEVTIAEARIRSHIKETPLDYAITLSKEIKINVFDLKNNDERKEAYVQNYQFG